MRPVLPTIVLIGFMGSGKTSVGRAVARALGREFADTDELVEQAIGATVGEIFRREGELGFRRREIAAIDRAIAVPAAGVVGEAVVALVLADALLEKTGGDSLAEVRRNLDAYLAGLDPQGAGG